MLITNPLNAKFAKRLSNHAQYFGLLDFELFNFFETLLNLLNSIKFQELFSACKYGFGSGTIHETFELFVDIKPIVVHRQVSVRII